MLLPIDKKRKIIYQNFEEKKTVTLKNLIEKK